MKVALVSDSCEHLGLEYISGMLKSARYETKMFIDPQLFDDENISIKWLSRAFDYKKKLISHLKAYEPSLVAFSVVTDFYQWACQIAAMIKQEMDVPIIFGGIHPTSVPERVINNDFVDMVCVGEGEYPMLELVDSMQRGQIDYSIKNIWFKKNGQVIRNKVRSLIEDLDSLPMLDKDLYYSAAKNSPQCYQITASRGCVYACSYCCHSHLREIYKNKGTYFRRRSVKNVIQELKIAKERYHPRYINFRDESLGMDIGWLRDFSNQYKAQITLPFLCYVHPCHVSQESVSYLKDAGCCEVEIGIQSWNKTIRENLFNRWVSNAQMELAIRLLNKAHINVLTNEIVGLPNLSDDHEHILKASEIYIELRPLRSLVFTLKYFPYTEITQRAIDSGLLSAQNQKNILDGRFSYKYLEKNNIVDERTIKYRLLLSIIRILPRKIAKQIVKKRLYRYFPVFFTRFLIDVIARIPPRSVASNLSLRTTINHYKFFLKH